MTNLSKNMSVVSKGYTFVKSSSFNGACTVKCFVRVLRGLGFHTRIEVVFPRHGVFSIGQIWLGTTELGICEPLPVLGLMAERTEKGVEFWGDVSVPAYKFEEFVDRLLAQLDVWVDFNGASFLDAKYHDSVCLVEFRSYDFKPGQECQIFRATDNFTFAEIAERAVCPRAMTNYALVLPGKAEDYVNSDLLGRDDYDPCVEVGKSGSYYAFIFELGC